MHSCFSGAYRAEEIKSPNGKAIANGRFGAYRKAIDAILTIDRHGTEDGRVGFAQSVRTGGPMQVSIALREQRKGYRGKWTVQSVRKSSVPRVGSLVPAFTGLSASYGADIPFADFNAGYAGVLRVRCGQWASGVVLWTFNSLRR